jgi:Raf kinase inhibitor-like YbhB/YbcL family protein
VIWNIEPSNNEINENSTPLNSIQGKTDFGEIAYGGPAPPDKEHTYVFKLYALDNKLSLEAGSSKSQVEEAMKNHVIAESKLEGRYAP